MIARVDVRLFTVVCLFYATERWSIYAYHNTNIFLLNRNLQIIENWIPQMRVVHIFFFFQILFLQLKDKQKIIYLFFKFTLTYKKSSAQHSY